MCIFAESYQLDIDVIPEATEDLVVDWDFIVTYMLPFTNITCCLLVLFLLCLCIKWCCGKKSKSTTDYKPPPRGDSEPSDRDETADVSDDSSTEVKDAGKTSGSSTTVTGADTGKGKKLKKSDLDTPEADDVGVLMESGKAQTGTRCYQTSSIGAEIERLDLYKKTDTSFQEDGGKTPPTGEQDNYRTPPTSIEEQDQQRVPSGTEKEDHSKRSSSKEDHDRCRRPSDTKHHDQIPSGTAESASHNEEQDLHKRASATEQQGVYNKPSSKKGKEKNKRPLDSDEDQHKRPSSKAGSKKKRPRLDSKDDHFKRPPGYRRGSKDKQAQTGSGAGPNDKYTQCSENGTVQLDKYEKVTMRLRKGTTDYKKVKWLASTINATSDQGTEQLEYSHFKIDSSGTEHYVKRTFEYRSTAMECSGDQTAESSRNSGSENPQKKMMFSSSRSGKWATLGSDESCESGSELSADLESFDSGELSESESTGDFISSDSSETTSELAEESDETNDLNESIVSSMSEASNHMSPNGEDQEFSPERESSPGAY